MERTLINKTLLEDNDCFGCGHDNPHGYKIEVYAEDGKVDELFGTFYPPDYAIGFPGVTHGGAIYTVFDCIAAWVPTYFRSEMKAVWMLNKAEMEYMAPSFQGNMIKLHAAIASEGDKWTPISVSVQALNESGDLLALGKFTFVPLSAERFKFVSGLSELPPNWAAFLRREH
jgi:acyl-CoA thioesterase FadM